VSSHFSRIVRAFCTSIIYAALDKEGVKLGKNNIGILAYADDIVLMVENKDKLKEQ
jgi:hypothetical protein